MAWRVTRTARLLAASSLTLSLILTDIAAAQVPPPPAEAATGGAAPPARVGRLSSLAGTVSFHAASAGEGADAWVAAIANTPVTTGDAVFAQAGGHVEIDVGNDLLGLDGGTELDLATLDDTSLVASEPQGRMFLAIGPQPQSAVNTIATPRGTLQIAGQGEYEIVAGDSATPTTVTIVQGAGTFTANGLQLQIAAGQTATVTGTDQLAGNVAPAGQPDPFLSAMLAALSRGSANLPPAVANMTGCRALAGVGAWRPSPQYGQVWYPPVRSGWAPYREGHWSWVQPWGWTWIDNESWGFAPFHYGRWIDDGGQWGWVPDGGGVPDEAAYPQPVYAPALVDWTDLAAGAVAGAAIGALAAGAIGWVPLAPNEPYYPSYRNDRGYFDRINRGDVRNIRNVSFTQNNFGRLANRRGATMVPRDAVLHGQPIRGVAHPFTQAAFQQARGLPSGHAPIGAPPAGFRQGTPGHGPAIQPAFFHPQHLEGSRLPFRGAPANSAVLRAGVPALRPHEQVETGRPGAGPGVPQHPEPGGQPNQGGAHPPTNPEAFRAGAPGTPGLPALRPHQQVETGRPGAAPGLPRHQQPGGQPNQGGAHPPANPEAMDPGAPSTPGRPALRPHQPVDTDRPGAEPVPPAAAQPGVSGQPERGGHAGLVAGAAAGAVGAGLAAHALTHGPAGPREENPARPNAPFQPHVAPAAVRPVPAGAPRPLPPQVARPDAPRPPAAPHVEAPRAPQPHVVVPRAPAPRPEPPRPQQAFRPPAARPEPPRAPAPHFAPPRPAAPPPRAPAPPPRAAAPHPAPSREPPHH
jgi:hypothetical protein